MYDQFVEVLLSLENSLGVLILLEYDMFLFTKYFEMTVQL